MDPTADKGIDNSTKPPAKKRKTTAKKKFNTSLFWILDLSNIFYCRATVEQVSDVQMTTCDEIIRSPGPTCLNRERVGWHMVLLNLKGKQLFAIGIRFYSFINSWIWNWIAYRYNALLQFSISSHIFSRLPVILVLKLCDWHRTTDCFFSQLLLHKFDF